MSTSFKKYTDKQLAQLKPKKKKSFVIAFGRASILRVSPDNMVFEPGHRAGKKPTEYGYTFNTALIPFLQRLNATFGVRVVFMRDEEDMRALFKEHGAGRLIHPESIASIDGYGKGQRLRKWKDKTGEQRIVACTLSHYPEFDQIGAAYISPKEFLQDDLPQRLLDLVVKWQNDQPVVVTAAQKAETDFAIKAKASVKDELPPQPEEKLLAKLMKPKKAPAKSKVVTKTRKAS